MSMKLGLFLVLVCLARPSFAWGDIGHAMAAQIATAFLTSEAQSEANTILDGQTIVDIASWADDVRTEPAYEWSDPLHFTNTPSWECGFTYDTDCVDDVCNVGALYNYSYRLQNLPEGEQQQEALKFLVHFHGDVHQPLHVAFLSDRGGNDIYGEFLGQQGNLHGFWDYAIIQQRINANFNGDQNSYTNYLIEQIQTGMYKSNNWTACSEFHNSSIICPDEWAQVTAELACTKAYVDENGNIISQDFDLGLPYQAFVQSTVDQQLAAAGVRMAYTLNKILGSLHQKRMASQLPSNSMDMHHMMHHHM